MHHWPTSGDIYSIDILSSKMILACQDDIKLASKIGLKFSNNLGIAKSSYLLACFPMYTFLPLTTTSILKFKPEII